MSEKSLPSRVYLAAWIAAEKALPAASLALIERYDELHRAWGKEGYPSPVPEELTEAREAIEADELACFAMSLRVRTNQEASKEWRATHAASEVNKGSESKSEVGA